MTTVNVSVTYRDGKNEMFYQVCKVVDAERRLLKLADWSACGHGEVTTIPFECMRRWK